MKVRRKLKSWVIPSLCALILGIFCLIQTIRVNNEINKNRELNEKISNMEAENSTLIVELGNKETKIAEQITKLEDYENKVKELETLKTDDNEIEEIEEESFEIIEENYEENTEEQENVENVVYTQNHNQSVLNSRMGINYFVSTDGVEHRESYYNLPMNGCISIMNSLGYYLEYWVRDDGVKMYGDYVMVAAELGKYPKGTIVETSLGLGMVVDTGEFTKTYPEGWDIAVEW